MDLVAHYTLYGHYLSEAGVKVTGALDFKALGFQVNNTIGPDFSVGFGPLVDLKIPDPPFETDRLNLYEKSLPLTFATATDTYSVWYEQPPAPGTDGDDLILYGATFDDPDAPPPLDEEGDPLPIPDKRHGYAGADTMIGNDFRNILFGDEGGDSIQGRGGNDEIWSGSGADNVDSGDGNDLVLAGPGGDTIYAGLGDDNVLGLGDDDVIYGGDGNDTLGAGMGSDSVAGQAGDDIVYLDNLDGTDIAEGGEGIDRIVIDARTSTVGVSLAGAINVTDFPNHASLKPEFVLADGTIIRGFEAVTFLGGFGGDSLFGADEGDKLLGGGGDDLISWSTGEGSLWGQGGDDTIAYLMGTGADDLDGGAGTDLLLLQATGGVAVEVDLSTLTAGDQTLPGGAVLSGFERLWFAGDADSLPLVASAHVHGGALGDTLVGGSAGDILIGGGGRDSIDGGQGDDTLESSGSGDSIQGGAGIDFLTIERSGAHIGASLDLSGAPRPGVDVSLLDGTKIDGVEQIAFRGGVLSDQVTGGLLADTLQGGGGSDLLNGGGGRDSIDGGAGNDLVEFRSGEGGDTLDGGEGFDGLQADVSASAAAVTLDLTQTSGQLYDGAYFASFTNFEKFEIRTGAGSDSIRGGDADPLPIIRTFGEFPHQTFFAQRITGDVIRTGAGADSIDGGKGADLIDAGAGDDRVWLSSGADVLEGGDDPVPEGGPKLDRDTLVVDLSRFSGAELEGLSTFVMPDPSGESAISHIAATGADVTDFERLEFHGIGGKVSVVGGAYEDSLVGGGQGDSLGGGGGDDTLAGGTGDDTLAGGGGNDVILAGAPGDADNIDGGLGVDTLVIDRAALNLPSTIDFRPSFGILSLGPGAVLSEMELLDFRGGLNSDTVRVDYAAHHLHGGFSAGFDRAFVDLSNVDHDVTAHWTTGLNGAPRLEFDNGLTIERFVQFNIIIGQHDFTITNAPPQFTNPQVNITNVDGFKVVKGTPGPDTLIGSFSADQITGGAGADIISGSGGDDRVFGGDGGDTLAGDFGADTLMGEGGDDSAVGGFSQDSVDGGPGRDTLVVDDGPDTVVGGSGDDVIDDHSAGGASIDGGSGLDVLVLDRSGSASDLTVTFKGGNGGVSDGTVAARTEELHLTTGAGNDTVALSKLPATSHTVDVGGGQDQVSLDLSTAPGPVDFHDTGAGSSQTVVAGGASITVSHAEQVKVTGGAAGDTLAGGSAHGQATLSGGGGHDSLSSSGTAPGGDSLSGGDGPDTLVHSGPQAGRIDAGAGTDVVTVDRSASAADLVVTVKGAVTTLSDSSSVKGAETVTVKTGTGHDSVDVSGLTSGTHSFDGGGGSNAASIDLSHLATSVTHVSTGPGPSQTTAAGISVTLTGVQSVTVTGGSANDTLRGGAGSDNLSGMGGADSHAGGAGDNKLNGGEGGDTITGGAGKDVLVGGAGADLFLFGAGDGRDKVRDFDGVGGDRLLLDAGTTYALTDNAAGHAVVNLGHGTALTVLNVDASALDDWLVFG